MSEDAGIYSRTVPTLVVAVIRRSNHSDTAGVMSRCRFIDVHIFSFVQATLLGSVAFERRVILDSGYEIHPSNSKTLFFGKHLKECVAIAYFQLPVNRKQEKRREFFRRCLHYGTSYAHAASGI